MTTTTLTFLVILLSITTLAFFILSIFAIRRTNQAEKLNSLNIKAYQEEVRTKKGLLNIIDTKTKEISDLCFKLESEVEYQDRQINKHKEIFEQDLVNMEETHNKQIESLSKDNKDLLNLVELLERECELRLKRIFELEHKYGL